MAYISHDPDEDKNKPKFFLFRKKFNWPPYQALGFLCAFWINVLKSETYESGDISDWTGEFLADRIGLGNVDPNELWEALTQGYIEAKPDGRFLVQDWIKIAGPWLRQKYANRENGRERLSHIWAQHGMNYGREIQTLKSPESNDKAGEESDESRATVGLQSAYNQPNRANKAVISPPKFAPLRSSLSTPLPSSYPEEDLKAFIKDTDTSVSHETVAGIDLDITLPEKPDSTVRGLIDFFYDRLTERLKETPAGFNGGAAGKGFKKLLKDFSIDDIQLRIVYWVRCDDPFIVKRGYRVEDFFTYFNKLKDGPIANQGGQNGKQSFYDGAATVY